MSFDGVTVYYFRRSQGFTSVPSQGGSTLGEISLTFGQFQGMRIYQAENICIDYILLLYCIFLKFMVTSCSGPLIQILLVPVCFKSALKKEHNQNGFKNPCKVIKLE